MEEISVEQKINGEHEEVEENELMETDEPVDHDEPEDHEEEQHEEETTQDSEEMVPDTDELEISPSELQEIEIEPCRLCDDVSDKMFNIFEDNPEGYQLIGLIKENLPIVLYKTDPLSKQVCEKCVLNLQIISSLKKRSRKTQEKYVEKLKNEADTSDKNVLLFLGCTGSKLVDNGDDEEEEEEELKDECTSTDDLTILCANCKTSILDASTVNGDVELAGNLHEVIRESLRRNRVQTGDKEPEKVLRRRKIQPIYHEIDDSSNSSTTDLHAGGDDVSQYDDTEVPSEVDTEDSSEERPAKRRKIDKSSKEIQDEIDKELAKRIKSDDDADDSESMGKDSDRMSEPGESESERIAKIEEERRKMEEERKQEEARIEEIKKRCEEIFSEDDITITFAPKSLVQISLDCINVQNIPDYTCLPYEEVSSVCKCKVCGQQFRNLNLLALHEPTHMDVDIDERIDNPNPWPKSHPFAKIRNKWLTCFDEAGDDDEDVDVDVEDDNKDNSPLLVEDTEKTMAMSKKDEVVLVNMKPMVNGIYLGDYTKEERKAFYQCMRIGGQTKRFCPLCRYCFKDNWAIESHYFSFACFYTCRYCGMRFNKQRHRFEDHTKEHKKKKDSVSDKIYTASKVNNTLPKVIQPDKVKRIVPGEPEKPREIRLEDYSSPPVITKGGFEQRNRYSMNQQTTFQPIKIKEEPKDIVSSQSKTQNQAYFCRKCYKVFFKLDEFNAHSKNCDYNTFTPSFRSSQGSPSNSAKVQLVRIKQEPSDNQRRSNGDISNTGRPVRNCAKDIGPYKDEVYIPKQILNETVAGPPQSFICHICGTPFPTIYSRNSHMRIHKGEGQGSAGTSPQMAMQQNILKQRLQQQQQHNIQMQRAMQQQMQQKHIIRQKQLQQKMQQQQQLHQQQFQQQQNNYMPFEEIRVKEEPVDCFEPMVEIQEGHERSPSPIQTYNPTPPNVPREIGGGAVSLTPIVKKPALNPNILKLVENNPNISLVSKKTTPQRNGDAPRGNIIKNAGGYQGPYAPTNQQPKEFNGSVAPTYITVSPNLMPNDDNKSYKCSSCWEAFSNKSHLYFHKKNQCEGSRFPCPFCKKRFGTEAAYSSHIFYSHPE